MTVLGLLLGAFGLVLLNFGNPPAKSNAGTETYTSDWQATKILTVKGVVGTTETGYTGIGVWEWEVNGTIGTIDAPTRYHEKWMAPTLSNTYFNIPPGRGCVLQNVDPKKLLAGCLTEQNHVGYDDTSKYYFTVQGVEAYGGYNWGGKNAGSPNPKTSSCIQSPRDSDVAECIFQTGSYSFAHIFDMGAPTRMRWLGSGTMTPLQWHVEGEIVTP